MLNTTSSSLASLTRFSKRAVSALFLLAVIAVAGLMLLSVIVLSVRLYRFSQPEGRTLSIKSDSVTDLQVFSLNYRNDTGEVTVSGIDGEKVLAPGSEMDYVINIKNEDIWVLDFVLTPEVELASEMDIPIEVRLIGPGGDYLVGDADTWAPVEALNSVEDSRTIMRRESVAYVFQWRWAFSSGNDEYDTWLGTEAVNGDIGIGVDFSIQAQENRSEELNGPGYSEATWDMILILIVIVIVFSGAVLLILFMMKRLMQEM